MRTAVARAEPIPAEALAKRIDAFLAARGLADRTATASAAPKAREAPTAPAAPAAPAAAPEAPEAPASFVCEEDVRNAVKAGKKILVGERSIITPAARDAGEVAKVFVWQSYPG